MLTRAFRLVVVANVVLAGCSCSSESSAPKPESNAAEIAAAEFAAEAAANARAEATEREWVRVAKWEHRPGKFEFETDAPAWRITWETSGLVEGHISVRDGEGQEPGELLATFDLAGSERELPGPGRFRINAPVSPRRLVPGEMLIWLEVPLGSKYRFDGEPWTVAARSQRTILRPGNRD